MTVVIWDGENMLADRIVTMTNRGVTNAKGKPLDYLVYGNNSKIITNTGQIKATCYGEKIAVYTILGDATNEDNLEFFLAMENTDVKSLAQVAKAFPEHDILRFNATYLFISESGRLSQLGLHRDDDTQEIRLICGYWDKADIKNHALVFGLPQHQVNYVEQHFIEGFMTPIEFLVLAQATYGELGRAFDHYHLPTGNLKEHLDLSDRQRQLVSQKLAQRMSLPWRPIDSNVINR